MKTIQVYCTEPSWFLARCLALVVFLFIPTGINAQEADIDFGKFYGDVKAPSAPAFTIMGTNPSEISRPKSYRQLELALTNNFIKDGSPSLPKDFSLEFSPYWLKNRPYDTFEDVYKYDPLGSALKNLSFSVASLNQNSSGGDTTFLALGARTTFDFGRPRKELEELTYLKELKARQREITSLDAVYSYFIDENTDLLDGTNPNKIEELKKELDRFIMEESVKMLPGPQNVVKLFKDDFSKMIDTISSLNKSKLEQAFLSVLSNEDEQSKVINDMLSKTREAASRLQVSLEDRVGFRVELATAIRKEFRNNDIDDNTSPTAGIWVTPSYSHETLPIEFLGAFRYIRDNQDFTENTVTIDWTNNVDLGAKLIYKLNKFSLEGEFIYRIQTQVQEAQMDGNGFSFRPEKETFDRKIDFTAAYQISENLSLSYTYGKNFDLPILNGDLISGLNINFGLGGIKPKLD